MKTLVLTLFMLASTTVYGQANFPELDLSDVLSFETDIVSKFGGKYETELSVVAMFNDRVLEKEPIVKASGGQKKMQGTEMKESSINLKFTVKVLQESIADLLERLGDNQSRVTLQLMVSRRFSMTTNGNDVRDYPGFVSLSNITRKLRSASRNIPDAPVWNVLSVAEPIEDFEPNRVAVLVRHKINVLRMRY